MSTTLKRDGDASFGNIVRYGNMIYNHESGCTLIEVDEELSDGIHASRIYYKIATSNLYRCLPIISQHFTHRDAVTIEGKPLVYYSEYRLFPIKTLDGGKIMGCELTSINAFHLVTFSCRQVVSSNTIIVPGSYDAAWLDRLLSVSSDEKTLTCVLGVEKRFDSQSKITYVIGDVAHSSGSVSIIRELSTAYY